MLAALLSYLIAIGLLTVTPGVDTALVLRTRMAGGQRAAFAAAVGIGLGCLLWGTGAAVGLGAVLEAAPRVYAILRWCGALYLVGCGLLLIVKARRSFSVETLDGSRAAAHTALRRGLLTNLLNPKIGIFYVSFLPQFVPAGVPPGPFMVVLALIHVLLTSAWFSLLIVGFGHVRPLVSNGKLLLWLDRATGGVFVGFGLKLALQRA